MGLLRCDYLVVGAGATGMAFVDTLLAHHPGAPSVVILDRRPAPGGHWNDSYPYVTLHQSCVNYGVESEPLEAAVADTEELLATRGEILAYYGRVMERFVAQHGVTFLPGIAYDFASGACEPVGGGGAGPKIEAATVVDARFTEPDLPVHVAPTFEYDPAAVDVVPPNGLPAPGESVSGRRYCVVGAGKTGQDTIIYLQVRRPASNLRRPPLPSPPPSPSNAAVFCNMCVHVENHPAAADLLGPGTVDSQGPRGPRHH